MTASVIFNFDEYLEGETVYMIPLSAVAMEVGMLDGRSDRRMRETRARQFLSLSLTNPPARCA